MGKLEAWHLAEMLGVTPEAVHYVGAGCSSATLRRDGVVPSQSPWVEKVRVAFAEALGQGRPDLYVPEQHNTQWLDLLADLEVRTHDLAAEVWAWRARARTGSQAPCTGQLISSPRAPNGTASTPMWHRHQ